MVALIRYALKCAEGHSFESWFQSAAAYESLAAAGRLSCPTCGTSAVHKALMAPGVAGQGDAAEGQGAPAAEPVPDLRSAPDTERARKISRLRAEVERNSEDVGRGFAREARRIHDGEAPARAIRGEARADEARALLRDGIPVLPLPFLDRKKTH